MNVFKKGTLALLTLGLLSSGIAMADGHGGGHWGHGGPRTSVGIYVGPGFGGYYPRPYYPRPYYYGDPYFYGYPPAVVYQPPVIITQPQQPPVYVEQPQIQAQPQVDTSQPPAQAPTPSVAAGQDYFWYHCDKPEGYYPYVKECPGGWQKVTPEPPK